MIFLTNLIKLDRPGLAARVRQPGAMVRRIHGLCTAGCQYTCIGNVKLAEIDHDDVLRTRNCTILSKARLIDNIQTLFYSLLKDVLRDTVVYVEWGSPI